MKRSKTLDYIVAKFDCDQYRKQTKKQQRKQRKEPTEHQFVSKLELHVQRILVHVLMLKRINKPAIMNSRKGMYHSPYILNLYFIPGIQTFLASSLLPDLNAPKAPSVSCTKAVHSRRAAMNKNV